MEFDLVNATHILSRTPSVLEALLGNLPREWTQENEGPQTWSPFDVVGHLVHGEREDWISRARIILDHGPKRGFAPFDRFAQFESSKGKTLETLLDEFAALRGENLDHLKKMALSPADLEKKGTHPDLGEVTMKQLLATWVTHDLGHLGQISRVMAKQYREQVGPWIEHIPVLTRG